jgi:hypothetical protein
VTAEPVRDEVRERHVFVAHEAARGELALAQEVEHRGVEIEFAEKGLTPSIIRTTRLRMCIVAGLAQQYIESLCQAMSLRQNVG